jgi:hypothetical protein
MSSDKEDMTRSIKLPPTINIALRNIKDAKVIRGRIRISINPTDLALRNPDSDPVIMKLIRLNFLKADTDSSRSALIRFSLIIM